MHDGRASLAQTKIGWRVEVIAERYDPFGGVHGVQWVLHHLGMDRTREFWLRLAVIGSALLLSSALAAFFA
ncbi:MAG: hypothetical protein WDN23_12015 [Edaphobacter sp.]